MNRHGFKVMPERDEPANRRAVPWTPGRNRLPRLAEPARIRYKIQVSGRSHGAGCMPWHRRMGFNHVTVDVTWTLRNETAEIGRVAAELDQVFAESGLEQDLAADLQIALDEILSNVVNHAYPGRGTHEISVRLRILSHQVIVEVTDAGVAFDPRKAPTPAVGESLEDREVGGLGIHFVLNLMDRVEYERRNGYNHLQLVKERGTSG